MTIVKPKPLAEFQTPWEKKGEDYDPEKGKEFIHYLATQAWEQQEAAKKATTDLTTVAKDRDEFKSKVESAQRADETELERITRENTELKAKAAKADEPDLEKLRLKVALKKGLDETAMARLVGNTEEELMADADEFLQRWAPNNGDGEGDGNEHNGEFRVTPRTNLRSAGDPNPGEGRFDADKAAEDYVNRRGGLF